MKNEADELALRPLLRRLFLRGVLVLALLVALALLLSLFARDYLQQQFAEHLTQTVRNDLLIGNNAVALKTLNQNLGENFTRISYSDRGARLFELIAQDHASAIFTTQVPIAVCLDEDQKSCSATLTYEYSLLHYVPLVAFASLLILVILSLFFWIFRRHVMTYYREALKSQNEAALGRLSARICHDLKLPTLIFQRVAYIDDPAQFLAIRPQLQSHLQRLYAMLEKLKHAEVEGLVRMETHILQERQLHAFLSSIAPTPERLRLSMRPELRVYLDLEKFERSLANLVLNAFQAGAQQVKVNIQSRQHELVATVENDGPPIEATIVQNFLHDPNRLSSSLGLRMVKENVLAHGGQCELESHARITRFTLYFPNTVIISEPVPVPSEVRPIPTAVQVPTIWLDSDLLAIARSHITPEERTPFVLASDSALLNSARLIVSRSEAAIDRAIEQSIPIILAGSAAEDFTWLEALRSRLRMLKKVCPDPRTTLSSAMDKA